MGSLPLYENPFPTFSAYDAGFVLGLDARLAEINSRIVYTLAGSIDWTATDAWRVKGIRELPSPSTGMKYVLQNHHLCCVPCAEGESYHHQRRSVKDHCDPEHTRGAQLLIHLA